MGLRFRRSIRIARGVRINLGSSGATLSLRARGASLNIGPKGVRETVSLPGTGLSYSTMLRPAAAPLPQTLPQPRPRRPGLAVGLVAIIAFAVVGAMLLPGLLHP